MQNSIAIYSIASIWKIRLLYIRLLLYAKFDCYIFDCFYMEDSIAHYNWRFDCYQRLLPVTHHCSTSCSKLIFIIVIGMGAPLSRFLDGGTLYINFPKEYKPIFSKMLLI